MAKGPGNGFGEVGMVITGQKQEHPIEVLKPVMTLEDVLEIQKKVKAMEVSSHVLNYIVHLVSATRNREEIKLGASPRASIALMKASSAWALLEGRDYVIPEDVVSILPWILRHRIILHPKALITGKTTESIIAEIVKNTPIP